MAQRMVILGSQSPRRKEILSYFSLPFKQVTPLFDEEAVPFKGDPKEYVKTIAKGKADSLAPLFPHEILLTADTTVYKSGKIYGKPIDLVELKEFLNELQGQWHSVFTAITIQKGDKQFHEVEETKVLFNPLTEAQIDQYQAHLPWQDKAGGYMVQLAGSLMINRIDGCFYNVMGLPTNALCQAFKQIGIDLWSHLKT